MEQLIKGPHLYEVTPPRRRERAAIPPQREVSRPHLVRRIEEGMAGRLVLLTAPAGWGKSSLLAEWARQTTLGVAWVDCHRYGESGARMVKGIVGALDGVCPDVGKDLFAMLRSPRPLATSQLFDAIGHAIEDHDAELALVLDDFQAVDDKDVIDAVYALITAGPENLRVLVSSRMAPHWPLARMRVAGEVLEIGTRELAFGAAEIKAFLADGPASDDVVDALLQRSGGWAAGVRLAKLWLRSQDDSGHDTTILDGSQRDISDYMAEEIMAHLSPDLRRFLYATAMVDRFSVSLADAMLGSSRAAEMLELVERQDLFLIPDDGRGEWYRYHDVFREFLLARVGRELGDAKEAMLERAIVWLREHGFLLEAAACLLKMGQGETAAGILDGCAQNLLLRDGEATTLIRLTEQIPADVVSPYPSLQRFYAWALVLVGRLDDAETIARGLESHGDARDAAQERYARSEAASIRSRIAAYRGDHEATIRYGLAALQCGDDSMDWFRADALLSLGFAYRATGQLDQACDAFGKASELGWRSRFANAALWGSRYQALTFVSRGQLEDASSQLQHDMERARDAGMTNGAAFAALLVGRGEVRYERNDLSEARDDLTSALRLAREAGDAKILMNVHVALALLEAAEGHRREAIEAARAAIRVFDGTAEKAVEARLALRYGDLSHVRRWMDAYITGAGDDPSFRHGEAEQLMLTRALMATGDTERARSLLLALLQEAEASGRGGSALSIRILLAQVEDRTGEPDRADEYARDVIDLAMRERYVRSILDEDASFLGIVRRAMRHDPSPARREYARAILQMAEAPDRRRLGQGNGEQSDALTPRQHEVLRLMMDGLSNREIADELYLAEGTVKAHMNQIFTKLMVRNRAEAIRAAQRLGIAS